jgi:putative transposase
MRMGQRKVSFALGEFYHVYNRGTDKRDIFLDNRDYKRFTELLYVCNSTQSINLRDIHRETDSVFQQEREQTLVAIGAYCLMPNHFHILLTPVADDGVTRFMNKLGTSYSMYFNKKYDRTGALFQGRFKAKMVVVDEYMKYLYAYIHLNPVKLIDSKWKDDGIRDFEATMKYLSQYSFSSLPRYIGPDREENSILDESLFPDYFSTVGSNIKELAEWLLYSQE